MVTPVMQADTIHIDCPSEEALAPFIRALAPLLEPGDVLFLHGPLGAGKTTLTQHLAKALGVGSDQYVSSPSFALLHQYHGFMPVFHMDLYRLNDEIEVEEAGLLEAFEQQGITLVEWPERLGSLQPESRLDIHLVPNPDGSRRLILKAQGEHWRRRLVNLKGQLAGRTF